MKEFLEGIILFVLLILLMFFWVLKDKKILKVKKHYLNSFEKEWLVKANIFDENKIVLHTVSTYFNGNDIFEIGSKNDCDLIIKSNSILKKQFTISKQEKY